MTLGDAIKMYREKNGMSLRQFASRTDLSYGYIGMLERGRTSRSDTAPVPSITAYYSIAKAMGMSVQELMEMIDEDSPVSFRDDSSLPNAIPISHHAVPLLGSIAAGEPILTEQEYDTYIEADSDVRCDYALRVDGDSMEPTVRYGDLVFIRQQDDVDDGQIAAVLIDDSATLKRVYHIPNGLQLISENPKYAPRQITYPTCDAIRILGRAVAYKRLL